MLSMPDLLPMAASGLLRPGKLLIWPLRLSLGLIKSCILYEGLCEESILKLDCVLQSADRDVERSWPLTADILCVLQMYWYLWECLNGLQHQRSS